jgi:uncharacterized tellurite resistance protein B-like protein
MEQNDLQKLLLKTVVCTIACDGEIHEKEIAEMNLMVSQAVCFRNFNGGEVLQPMLDAVSKKGGQLLHEYFDDLKSSDLSIVQELLILEVILRIIYADERFDSNEEMFLKLVMSHLHVHSEVVLQRFGKIPIISDNDMQSYKETYYNSDINKISKNYDEIKFKAAESFVISERIFSPNIDLKETR